MIREAFATPAIEEQVSSRPEFTVDARSSGALALAGSIDVTRSGDHFDLAWRESDYLAHTTDEDDFAHDVLVRARGEAERFPGSPRVRTNVGVVFLNANRVDDAIAEFEAALRLDAYHHEALVGLACAKLRQGRMGDVERPLRALRERFAEDPTGPILASLIAMHTRHAEGAIAALRHAISLDTRLGLPRYLLGMVLLTEQRHPEAINQLRSAARIEPRAPVFQRGLGIAYAVCGDLKRAARAFRTSVALAPLTAEAVHGLATVLIRHGDNASASRVLAKHLANHGNDRVAQELLARADRQREAFRDERRHLLAALDSLEREASAGAAGERARLMNNIGVACFALNDLMEAESWFGKAIEEAPRPTAFRNLYTTYVSGGQTTGARAVLRQWLGSFPEDEEARVIAALGHAEAGDRGRAIRELRELMDGGIHTARAYGGLGALLSEDPDSLDEALQIARAGCERFPALPEMSNNLAYVHLVRGEPAEAKQVLERVEQDIPLSVHLTATYGLLKLWENDVETARELYREASRLARSRGKNRLSEMVRQKMHLELGRYFVRAGETVRALAEAKSGLKLQGHPGFRDDLAALRRQIVDAVAGRRRTSGSP